MSTFLTKNKESIDELYTSTAEIGKAFTIIGTFAGIIIGVIAIIVGAAILNAKKVDSNGKPDKEKSTFGWVAIVVGVLIIIGSIVYCYIILTYKPAAAVAGVGWMADTIGMNV